MHFNSAFSHKIINNYLFYHFNTWGCIRGPFQTTWYTYFLKFTYPYVCSYTYWIPKPYNMHFKLAFSHKIINNYLFYHFDTWGCIRGPFQTTWYTCFLKFAYRYVCSYTYWSLKPYNTHFNSSFSHKVINKYLFYNFDIGVYSIREPFQTTWYT